jgi:hypothetical protein
MKRLWISIAFALLAACSGPAASGDGEDDGSGGEEPQGQHQSARELIGIAGPAAPWSEMSHEDKEFDMIGRFLPIMGEYFREHDAERFENFQCESCHGTDMRERNFEMPSTQLPTVPLPGTPQYASLQRGNAEMMRFMEEDVTPTMQTMLGMGATFTCNGCHRLPNTPAQ